MSLIASFYILPINRLDDLLVAAKPKQTITKRRVLGLIPISKTLEEDVFWDFLKEVARESSGFEFSGTAFCDLDLYLEAENTMLFDLGIADVSEQLSSVRGTSMALFDRSSAQEAVAMLNTVGEEDSTIRRFYESDGRGDVADEGVRALRAALNRSRDWLSEVGEAEVGLLIVG